MTAKTSAHLVLTLFWTLEAAFSVLLFAWGYPALGAFLGIVALGVAVYVIVAAFALMSGAPYVGMEIDRVAKVLAFAELKPGERLVDLGSGDGRIVIAAAKAGAKAEGWEVNPYLWAYSVWKIYALGLQKNARVHLGSYWPVSFQDADVVTLFLITGKMPQMEEKMQRELRLGSRVVSFVFPFPEWKPEKQGDNTFLYRKA